MTAPIDDDPTTAGTGRRGRWLFSTVGIIQNIQRRGSKWRYLKKKGKLEGIPLSEKSRRHLQPSKYLVYQKHVFNQTNEIFFFFFFFLFFFFFFFFFFSSFFLDGSYSNTFRLVRISQDTCTLLSNCFSTFRTNKCNLTFDSWCDCSSPSLPGALRSRPQPPVSQRLQTSQRRIKIKSQSRLLTVTNLQPNVSACPSLRLTEISAY